MKIVFEDDGSFLEIYPNNNELTLVMCGKKSFTETTMSAAELNMVQVNEIIEFLVNWKNNKK